MKIRPMLLFVLLTPLAFVAGDARGQGKEFELKTVKQYWLDDHRRPWNDLGYQMAVRIAPEDAKSLVAEVAIDNPPIKYAVGEFHLFSLKRDAGGTFADVDYLVYKDSPDPIIYQIELRKGDRSVPIVFGASKVEMRNDSPNPPPVGLKQSNAIFLKDWLFIGGVMLVGLILIYVLAFRWLFNGLLFKRRWPVPGAEHFTWSVGLLMLMGLSAALTLFYLGPRLETWIIIGVLGAFWLLHAIVWLVSGKEA